MGGNVMLGQGNMELRQQMLLQRQQAMQMETEAVEMPNMEPMSFPEAIGYGLGQVISSMFSSGTSPTRVIYHAINESSAGIVGRADQWLR